MSESPSYGEEYKNKGALLNYFMELTKNEPREDIMNFGIGLIAVAVTCAVIFVAASDPKAMTESFYVYCVFGILPAIIGVIIASKIFSGPTDITKLYFYGGVLLVFIISMYMFHQVMNPGTITSVSYLLAALSFLVFIVGLAILYRIFVRTIVNTRGWTGFFLKFLFLIPCLLIDLMETVFAELKIAPKMVIVLFILEILIILAYIYIPRLTKSSGNSVVLLDKPLFLTRLQSIGNANQLFMDVNDVENPSREENTIRQNYAISMWVYVNDHPKTFAAYSKETDIFRYGYPGSDVGHPRVAYFNDTADTNKTNKFIVYINDGASKKDMSGVLLDMPMQSWNQLVISYNETVVDIFVNGDLARSVPLAHYSRPEYNVGDVLEVGYGDNTHTGGGLHGAICNVVYHKAPLTTFQVAGEYNLNRYRNPPTSS